VSVSLGRSTLEPENQEEWVYSWADTGNNPKRTACRGAREGEVSTNKEKGEKGAEPPRKN